MKYSSLNASDRVLITGVAEHWIAGGGDADGFTWCADAIRERISELEAEKDAQPDSAYAEDNRSLL